MPEVYKFLSRFIIFVMVHSVLAIPSVKNRLKETNGNLGRFYRLYYNILSIIIFGWVMSAFRNSDVLYVFPGIWSLVLYALQIVFIAILIVCIKQTGVSLFLGISAISGETENIPTLVTKGWYQVVRHPLYLFTILFLLSNPVITVRWLVFTAVSIAYLLLGALLEEKRLAKEFGREYRAYQLSVPFMIPRIYRNTEHLFSR